MHYNYGHNDNWTAWMHTLGTISTAMCFRDLPVRLVHSSVIQDYLLYNYRRQISVRAATTIWTLLHTQCLFIFNKLKYLNRKHSWEEKTCNMYEIESYAMFMKYFRSSTWIPFNVSKLKLKSIILMSRSRDKIKQDVIIKDKSGAAKLTVWDEDVNTMTVGKSYKLTGMLVREYLGNKYLSTSIDIKYCWN